MERLLRFMRKVCGGKNDEEDGSPIAVTKQTEVTSTTSERVFTATTSDPMHQMATNQAFSSSLGRGIPKRSPLANINFDVAREPPSRSNDSIQDSDPDAILPVDPRSMYQDVQRALEDRKKLFERLRHPKRATTANTTHSKETPDHDPQTQSIENHGSNQSTTQNADSKSTIRLAPVEGTADGQHEGKERKANTGCVTSAGM